MTRYFGHIAALSARRGILLLMALVLGGCFKSTVDLSTVLKPVYPLVAGLYQPENPKHHPYRITRKDDAYLAKSTETEKEFVVKIFKLPEREGFFLIQLFDDSHPQYPYSYLFGQLIDDGQGKQGFSVFMLAEETLRKLPDYLQNLIQLDTKYVPTGFMIDGPRDTLYVLREVARRQVSQVPLDRWILQKR